MFGKRRPRVTSNGRRADLGDMYFRSRYEANYARYLNYLKEHGVVRKWEFEPETFWFEGIKRGTTSYLPDFKVTYFDGRVEYHEVKGYLDAKSQTKIKRMAKYHPHINLVLIHKRFYLHLEKTYKTVITNWEENKRGGKGQDSSEGRGCSSEDSKVRRASTGRGKKASAKTT